MPRAESEQRMTVGSGTLRARAPGQTPSVPTPLAGAAATSAVAVPWRSVSGWPASDVMFGPRSGWAGSSWESTSAISGLWGPTGGGTWPPTTWSRHQASGESGSSAGACARRLSRSGSAYASSPRARSAAASRVARPRATSHERPAIGSAPWARAIRPAARDPVRTPTIQLRRSALAAAAEASPGSTTPGRRRGARRHPMPPVPRAPRRRRRTRRHPVPAARRAPRRRGARRHPVPAARRAPRWRRPPPRVSSGPWAAPGSR